MGPPQYFTITRPTWEALDLQTLCNLSISASHVLKFHIGSYQKEGSMAINILKNTELELLPLVIGP